jgi:carbon monoxide dehydrogenase subunit G
MRAMIRSEVEVAAPAEVVWDYVTDWPRQGEWIPFTRVERLGEAHEVGGRFRAWTGIGAIGFWDTMTITAWQAFHNGSARCEVLHTGRLVRGEAEFAVQERGPEACTFTWWEHLVIPGGPVGALAWKVGARGMQTGVDRALRQMADRVVAERAGV